MTKKNIEKKQVSLTKGALFQIIGKLLTDGIAFFTTPAFTRVLSTGDYGKVSVYAAWCSICTLFVGLQVDGSIANARIEYSEEKLPEYMSSVLTMALISFSVILSLVGVFHRQLAGFINIRVDLVFFLVVQSFALFCINFYDAKLVQLKRTDKSMLLMTTVFFFDTVLALVFVFVLPCEKYISKIYGEGLPLMLIGFSLCLYILAKGKTFYNAEYWKFCLPISLPLIFHSAGHLILWQSDRIMIQKMVGESDTGIYSVSVLTAAVLITVFMAFNNAWVPYYYEYKKKNDIDLILISSKNYMLNIACLYAAFFLAVPELFKILAPESYWQIGLKIIPVLIFASFFRYLYLFPVNHEFYNKNTKLVAIGTLGTAILNIALNYVFIRHFSSIGAAFATCISTVFLFLFHLAIAILVIKNYEYPVSFYFRGLMPVGVALFLYYLLADFWILRWGITILIGAFLVVRLFKRKSLF